MRTLPLLALALSLSACMASVNTCRASDDRPMARDAMATPMAMTDADRLHVFITGNRGEIVTSQPVVGKAASPEVRAYAQDMIRMHEQVIDRAMALDLDPMDNPVSMAMSQQAQGVAGKLAGMNGAALDMAYIESQVVLHGQTLNTLDYVLIPNTRDAAARRLMEQTRPDVARHLERAKALHHEMMMANPSMAPAGR